MSKGIAMAKGSPNREILRFYVNNFLGDVFKVT